MKTHIYLNEEQLLALKKAIDTRMEGYSGPDEDGFGWKIVVQPGQIEVWDGRLGTTVEVATIKCGTCGTVNPEQGYHCYKCISEGAVFE